MTEESKEPKTAPRRKVLIVDDNDEVRSVFTISLELQGHKVIPCSTGNEAIELFQSEHPDIAILDHSLPGMKGIEVGKQIRLLENGRDIILALITGTDDMSLRQAAKAAGFDDFLVKPIGISELASWVDRAGLNPA